MTAFRQTARDAERLANGDNRRGDPAGELDLPGGIFWQMDGFGISPKLSNVGMADKV